MVHACTSHALYTFTPAFTNSASANVTENAIGCCPQHAGDQPAGAGKTLLARAVPGILPKMSIDEALDVTRIYRGLTE